MLSLDSRGGKPLCIGHRGAAALAPENTLRSFRAARDAGADLVEFDVLGLDSGELVVAHSHDLREVSHGATSGTLHGLSRAAASEVAPELPTLDDALAFFVDEAPELGVHVDLKDAASADDLLAALRRFGLVERTLVSSFQRRAVQRLARAEPALRTGISFPADRLRLSDKRGSAHATRLVLRGLRPLMPVLVSTLLTRSGASTLVLHHMLVGASLVRWARQRDVPVVVWTVDDPRDVERLAGVGVNAMVVNSPVMFTSTLST